MSFLSLVTIQGSRSKGLFTSGELACRIYPAGAPHAGRFWSARPLYGEGEMKVS